MNSKIIHLDSIPVTLTKHPRAKRVSIRVSEKGVRVSIPKWGSFRYAEQFVTKQEKWIKQHTKKYLEKKSYFSPDTSFSSREHTLCFEHADVFLPVVKIATPHIIVHHHPETDFSEEVVQKRIQEGITKTLRKEAHGYIPRRARELAQQHNFTYSQIRCKAMSSRWGSCSENNNLNFSIYLMLLDECFIDYVILHELTHTEYKHHQKDFWERLSLCISNPKKIDRELNTVGKTILF